MANGSIPVRATFEKTVKKVQLVFWGSTTSSALVEAFNAENKRIAKDGLEHVLVRKRPEDPIPFFELAVEGEGIAYIEISGSQPGGFVAVDEIRWSKRNALNSTYQHANAFHVDSVHFSPKELR